MSDDNPFETIESAQQYLRLLAAEVDAVKAEIATNIEQAIGDQAARRLDALHIVDYKLKQLQERLRSSLCILNDLRMLQRLLVVDEVAVGVVAKHRSETR